MYKFVLDLRPGDTVGDEAEPFHNGDGRVIRVDITYLVTDQLGVGALYSVMFADGSVTTTGDGTQCVPMKEE
jgi:hypothetical protein